MWDDVRKIGGGFDRVSHIYRGCLMLLFYAAESCKICSTWAMETNGRASVLCCKWRGREKNSHSGSAFILQGGWICLDRQWCKQPLIFPPIWTAVARSGGDNQAVETQCCRRLGASSIIVQYPSHNCRLLLISCCPSRAILKWPSCSEGVA